MTLREAVLKALKEKNGDWISGEALSNHLNVSRTTIWKQVKTLLDAGYVIESSPKKGYRIIAPADLLSPEEVLPGLETKLFGQSSFIYYQETDSTNKRARALAAEGYPEGTIVVAEKQIEGKGRRGRSWYSPIKQGIYLSLIIRPIIPLKQISRVSLLAAVAVSEALEEELNLKPQIKWPNDILINNRKIAGILSEAITDMDSIEYIVIGIGININNPPEEFPDDFRTPPTSALGETQTPVSRIDLLRRLLLSFENHYTLLQKGDFTHTLEKAKSLSLVIGKEVRLDEKDMIISGLAFDIDDNGFLLVKDQSGTIHTVMSGEISVLPGSPENN